MDLKNYFKKIRDAEASIEEPFPLIVSLETPDGGKPGAVVEVSRLEAAPWTVVRWLPTDIQEEALDALSLPTGARVAYDIGKNPVVLFQTEWSANYFAETNKAVPLSALPVQTARE